MGEGARDERKNEREKVREKEKRTQRCSFYFLQVSKKPRKSEWNEKETRKNETRKQENKKRNKNKKEKGNEPCCVTLSLAVCDVIGNVKSGIQ